MGHDVQLMSALTHKLCIVYVRECSCDVTWFAYCILVNTCMFCNGKDTHAHAQTHTLTYPRQNY